VITRQARLVARWLGLGFIHGVMNTDNASISGETIDYGPCAFLDTFDPAKRFSFIDERGRYAYGNQANIALWNLSRLAEALLPLFGEDEEAAVTRAREALQRYAGIFQQAWIEVFSAKLGIGESSAEDVNVIHPLLDLMREQEADFTLVFRHLASAIKEDSGSFLAHFREPSPVIDWLSDWRTHLRNREIEADQARALMRRSNPVFIPRNHRIEEVIQAGRTGDFGPFQRLHEILRRPFDEQPEHSEYESAPKPHEVIAGDVLRNVSEVITKFTGSSSSTLMTNEPDNAAKPARSSPEPSTWRKFQERTSRPTTSSPNSNRHAPATVTNTHFEVGV